MCLCLCLSRWLCPESLPHPPRPHPIPWSPVLAPPGHVLVTSTHRLPSTPGLCPAVLKHLPPWTSAPPPDCQRGGQGLCPMHPYSNPTTIAVGTITTLGFRKRPSLAGAPVPAGLVYPRGFRLPPPQPHPTPPPAAAGEDPVVVTLRGEAEGTPGFWGLPDPTLALLASVLPIQADLPLLHRNTFACGPHSQEPYKTSVSRVWTF